MLEKMKYKERISVQQFLMEPKSTVLYIVAFVFSFLLALITTPFSKKLAYQVGAIDKPKKRGMHKKPMPLAGGTAIVLAFTVTVLILTPMVEDANWREVGGIIAGGLFISIVGFFDDIYDLSAKFKLMAQIIAGLIVIYSGISINVITWPLLFGKTIPLPDHISLVLSLFWIVGITNAVNFIDGLDGLAAGVSFISALCFMFLSIMTGNPLAVLLTASLAGACMGFLPHNFNPATIFMGDTGSTFLGFILAVSSIEGLFKGYTVITVVVAILVLGLPIFDTAFAIIRRILKRQPVMQADRGHLHHRLVDKGYSQKKAVLTLYGISGGFGITGILIASQDVQFAMGLLCFMVILIGFNYYHQNNHTSS